jgi:CheY-like chemotaxis protein
VDILRLIQTTIDKKVELALNLDETLPEIEADPGQMQQLIMNLIINASEAMQGRDGKVVISTRTIDVDPKFIAQTFRSDTPFLTVGQYVLLEVQDMGCGMSEETLSKIFDPFFTTKFTGRGLGLAAVSGILRGHRGAVRVDSHLNEGTTFKIFLPVAQSPQPKSRVTGGPSPDTVNPPGWGTILLADDEDTVRRVAQAALQRSGYEVVLATDGKQAVELFKKDHGNIRLIILDLTMPVMGGEEALVKLREVDPLIPVLLSSGYNQVEIIQRFTKQTITGFIQKPYTVAQLNEAVTNALPGHNAG